MLEVPEIVRHAEALSRHLGFDSSCRLETGQLLHVLSTTIVKGTVLEIGTGAGYGAAWLASALRSRGDARLITIDHDPEVTTEVARMFAAWTHVEVLTSAWRGALGRGPFRLAFVDASDAKQTGVNEIVAALAPGGLTLIDDLTPLELWPAEWRDKPDPVREAWLHHPDLASTELRVAADHTVILGVKH